MANKSLRDHKSFEDKTLAFLNSNCENKNIKGFMLWSAHDIKPNKHRNFCCESLRCYILCGVCERVLSSVKDYQK